MRGFEIKALGEVAIRCRDIARQRDFYRDMLGLELLRDAGDGIVFFRIGPGHGGHTTVLALFDAALGRPEDASSPATEPATGPGSSLHHVALTVDYAAQEAALRWFASQGLEARTQHFGWIGWRGVFTKDPEGNTVELVAHDPSERDPDPERPHGD